MKYLKDKLILLACLLSCLQLAANNQLYCDTIIKRGVDSMLAKNYAGALTFLAEARRLSAENRWPRQQFLAINNIGLTYYFMLDYGEALHHFLLAYNIAIEENDATLEMTVLNNIAILYSREKNFGKATEYFLKAYRIAKEKNDKDRIGNYASNLGLVHTETLQLEKARTYLREAFTYLKDNPQRLLGARLTYARNQFKEGNIKEAGLLASRLLTTAVDSSYNDEERDLRTLLTSIRLKENRLAEARAYALDALERYPNLEEKIEIYEMLSDIYFRSKAYALALAGKDSVIRFRDSINTIRNGQLFGNSKLKFELLNTAHALSLNEARLSSHRRLLYVALLFTCIIITFFIWLLRIKAVRNRQKEVIAERSRKIMALEFENEKTQKLLLEKQFRERETAALLEQERLRNEIEIRNRKLSAKALYLSGRNELIDGIISSLSHLQDSTLLKHITQLKGYLRMDNEWDDFSTHFQEVNQRFLDLLRKNHPDLTANDVRFLTYIYMNLNTKEIAALLNITPEGCRKRKERISKKMQLPENSSLYEYLAGL